MTLLFGEHDHLPTLETNRGNDRVWAAERRCSAVATEPLRVEVSIGVAENNAGGVRGPRVKKKLSERDLAGRPTDVRYSSERGTGSMLHEEFAERVAGRLEARADALDH
jgi:hypothetical protein